MRESVVETNFVQKIKDLGGLAYKFVSPGRRNVPDRLVLLPVPSHARITLARYMYFAEIKAPGQKPRPGQEREIQRLRMLGYRVEVVDE